MLIYEIMLASGLVIAVLWGCFDKRFQTHLPLPVGGIMAIIVILSLFVPVDDWPIKFLLYLAYGAIFMLWAAWYLFNNKVT